VYFLAREKRAPRGRFDPAYKYSAGAREINVFSGVWEVNYSRAAWRLARGRNSGAAREGEGGEMGLHGYL